MSTPDIAAAGIATAASTPAAPTTQPTPPAQQAPTGQPAATGLAPGGITTGTPVAPPTIPDPTVAAAQAPQGNETHPVIDPAKLEADINKSKQELEDAKKVSQGTAEAFNKVDERFKKYSDLEELKAKLEETKAVRDIHSGRVEESKKKVGDAETAAKKLGEERSNIKNGDADALKQKDEAIVAQNTEKVNAETDLEKHKTALDTHNGIVKKLEERITNLHKDIPNAGNPPTAEEIAKHYKDLEAEHKQKSDTNAEAQAKTNHLSEHLDALETNKKFQEANQKLLQQLDHAKNNAPQGYVKADDHVPKGVHEQLRRELDTAQATARQGYVKADDYVEKSLHEQVKQELATAKSTAPSGEDSSAKEAAEKSLKHWKWGGGIAGGVAALGVIGAGYEYVKASNANKQNTQLKQVITSSGISPNN